MNKIISMKLVPVTKKLNEKVGVRPGLSKQKRHPGLSCTVRDTYYPTQELYAKWSVVMSQVEAGGLTLRNPCNKNTEHVTSPARVDIKGKGVRSKTAFLSITITTSITPDWKRTNSPQCDRRNNPTGDPVDSNRSSLGKVHNIIFFFHFYSQTLQEMH